MCTKKFLKVFGLLLVVGLLFAVAPTGQAQAATICVNPGGTDGCFASIQAAITAAGTGDTITVAAGSYKENVAIDKQVTLTGAGRDVTTVTAENTIEPVFRVTADGVTISGFTLTGASGHQEEPFQDGDGINLDGADHCVVTDNAFIANRQGAYVTGSNNAFQRNIISNNISNGVILIADKDEPTHLGDNNTFDGNTIADNIKYGLNISTSNNTFINNTITGNGGCGVALFGGTSGNTINFNAISGNTGAGGVYSIASYTNDATKNWWGTATGPIHSTNPGATGNKVTNVDYSPWLGFVPGTTPMDWYLNTTGTIQDGIDAAANGETIHVLAGTYVEDVVVADKYFNLIGEVDVSGAPVSILEGTLSIDNPSYGSLEKPEFTNIKNIYFEGTDNHLLILKNLNGGLVENCVFDGNGRFIATPNINGISAVSSPNGQQFTVKDSLFKDGLYVGIGGYATDVTVEDSTFINVKSGINLAGGANLTVTNVDFSVIAQGATSDTYGIRLGSDGLGSGKRLNVTGSTFTVDKAGLVADPGTYHAAIIIRAGALGPFTVGENQILGDVVNLTTLPLDISPNWWGSIAGPAAGTVVGTAEYVPWCGDAECSFLVYLAGSDLQAAIDATPAGGTLYVPAGTYTDAVGGVVGGYSTYGYQVGGITLILADGVVIANPDDSCFSITQSHTRILSESIGGAKCVPNGYVTEPTNSYSHGIVIDPFYVNVQDIVIDGLEIDGTGTNSGSGIYFMGYLATDVQILNNYIHDLLLIDFVSPAMTLPQETDLAGIVDIQGNLFQNVSAVETAMFGSGNLDMTYNSWGRYSVQAADVYTSDVVIFDPWTHAAIELRSTNPTVDNWANQVFVDDEITYQVVGVFQNITAADFTLTYDPTKLEVVSITPVTGIFQSADGDLVDELVEGQIRYDGTTYPGFTSADASGTLLYTVTFKALGAGDAALAIDPATDLFGMIPPSGPSTNVYAAELDSVTVHKIDRPTLTPTNLDGLYVVGVSHEISTVITNPATGGVWTESPTEPDAIGWIRISDALVADITQLQFKYTDGVWYDFTVQDTYGGDAVQQDNNDVIARFGNYIFGFDMPINWSDVDAFRVTFAEAGTHTVTIGIYDMMDTAENYYGTDDILLTEITQEITVYDPPTVSSDDIQGYYLTGEERIFNVSMDNPDDGADYALLIFDYTLEGVTTADITSFEYYAQDLNQWIDMGSRAYETYYDCTVGGVASICGQFGWAPGGFGPIAAGFENTSQFRINFANSFSAPLDFTLDLSGKLLEGDADWTPLTTFTGSLEVFDPATVTVTGDPYYIVGEAGNFQVEIVNPLSGRDYGDEIVFDIVIADIPVNGISAFSCTMDGFTWTNLLSLFQYTDPGATARLVGENGYFTVEAGDALTVDCSITYAAAGTFEGSGHMVDVYDKVTPAERIVSVDYSATAIVYTAPVITAAFPTGPYAAGVPVTVPVSITNPDDIPGPFELTLDLPAGTTFTFDGLTYLCGTEGCPAIPLTSLPITGSDLVITFAESFTGSIEFTLTDTTWDPDRELATLTQTGVIVGGDYGVTGTFSMQGRTKRAGVEVIFTWGGNSYVVTEETIEQISNNLVAILKYGGDYTITVNQARYLDITTDHGATINPATALSLVLDSLELRAGDANDDNFINPGDASIVGAQYGTGTIADQGDINFDNKVNIQDLALIGGNLDLQSANPSAANYAYGDWMQ